MNDFLIALQFLTRITIKKDLIITEDNFGKSSFYFPLVGFFLGCILALTGYVASRLFQPFTTVVFLIAAEVILTGGLHLDGYMDTCDGIFSGRQRERMLEIMKDSRVGANSVIGLFILILLKIGLLLELMTTLNIIPILFIMPLMGRWAMVYIITFFPYARKAGLGSYFSQSISKRQFIHITLYSVFIALVMLPVKLYLVLVLTAFFVHLIAHKINKILLGHTGDTYGAVNEMTETLYLLGCVVISKL
jgi:adenosylcobinamide-GDP ribazoletransferase